MSLPREANELQTFFDTLLVEQQRLMLAGKMIGATPEQTAANYQAAVRLNEAMTKIRKKIEEIYAGATAKDALEDENLLPLHNHKDDDK